MAIDATTDPYVLAGRVVTMGPAGVIDDGRVCIREGEIRAVLGPSDPLPADFQTATRVATGDTIYPGLIELHNHLSYNAMPLWEVPQRYFNNGQWRTVDDYRRRITKPSQVLGQTDGVMQALVRFVECRALLGGATTSQGITLANAGSLKRFYPGIVRNVERTDVDALPNAGTNIANPEPGGAAAYLARLGDHTCYLQHLSEGTDPTARGWFLRLQLGGDWAITDALCGIHAAALNAADYQVLASRGASMVWSPTSNYLLYGATVDLNAARSAGITIGLGCDWAPSGTKNLISELKVAWLASQAQGDVFTPQELVAMATVNPARILKWDASLGSIQEGRLADLLVVDGRTGDPFEHLIRARETGVTLVTIDGIPRYGQVGLMRRFGPGTEEIRVGGSRRVLNLADPASADLLGDLTLTQATIVLRDAMVRLPELATQLDTAVGAGEFAGGSDDAGESWRVVPDFEDEDRAIEIALGIAAEPYAFWVEPMTLDPITVADDPGHLRTLARALNLPRAIKEGLPPLYGESIPIADAASFLRTSDAPIAPQVLDSTRDLSELLRTFGALTLDDRRLIVDQARVLLEENYVHLPLKRTMHAVDPVQRLRLLRHRLDQQTDATMGPELGFHAELTDIFNSVRDLHTGYRLPTPFAGHVAWLPFLIEECVDRGRQTYLVTKVVGEVGPSSFEKGVEVTHWNGMPIDQAVARNAERQAGSNTDARHARGLNSLTIRPLARSLPPDEEWVTLRYRPAGGESGETLELTQRWLVFTPGDPTSLSPDALLKEATALGIDDHTDDIQEVRKTLFAPGVAIAEREAEGQRVERPMRNAADGLPTHMPGVFRAQIVPAAAAASAADAADCGYIRIFTFNVPDADAFVTEFVRLVEQLPARGLIIDLRGNGGGLIYAAEQLLQVLTPVPIEPERAQFTTTPLNLRICANNAPSVRFPGLELQPWIESISDAVRTGATYSQGFPITTEAACNAVGQRYYGPVVLITDPLCYSATDMFAAGFQDHGIGPVVGVGGTTGAGGANVWSHGLLRRLVAPAGDLDDSWPYVPLPAGADMRVAIRRTTRVGRNPGDVLEDLGVVPTHPYRMTRDDVLLGNRDLIAFAIGQLEGQRPHPIRLDVRKRRGRLPLVEVHTENVTRIDASVDRRWFPSLEVTRDMVRLDLEAVVPAGAQGPVELRVVGYDGVDLAVTRRESIDLR